MRRHRIMALPRSPDLGTVAGRAGDVCSPISLNGRRPPPRTVREFVRQEGLYHPDINDGVRVNIAPLQKAVLLTADVLAGTDVDNAIADRAAWRVDERRWCREGRLPKPGGWE